MATLTEIDSIIRRFETVSSKQETSLVIQLADAILAFQGKQTSSSVLSLFARDFSQNERRFIAVCLLRVLGLSQSYFDKNREFNIKTFDLFDDVLYKDVYPVLGVNKSQQTFEKQSRLRDVRTIAENAMSEAVAGLVSLEVFNDFVENYMRTLNNNALVKALILPFIPTRELTNKSQLQNLFKVIREYRESSSIELLESYETVQSVLKVYKDLADGVSTSYCDQFVMGMANKLEQIVKLDFLESDLAKPAKVTVESVEKKYPLYEQGRQLRIGFIVSNVGPGYAFDVAIRAKSLFPELLALEQENYFISRLEPSTLLFSLNARVIHPEHLALLSVCVEWRNSNETQETNTADYELQGQRADIDWENLELESPYSLEPVETVEQLVGRREILKGLIRQAKARSTESSYIYGQKRVGKTSIAKALRTYLDEQEGYTVVYLEGGEYAHEDPRETVNQLGAKICQNLMSSDQRLSLLVVPEFNGALNPLTTFLDQVKRLMQGTKIVFILDEFDELPLELYHRGPLADAFFLTMRVISSQPPFGFLLVGSEKMVSVMSSQGEQLNKFEAVRVDYFDRAEHWEDFHDLVKRPTKEWLEFSLGAIEALYEYTAGNPFYTVYLCRELFYLMIERRDSYVTIREVEEAVNLVLQKISSNSFQHFWEDGILRTGDRVEEVSLQRRRVLLALARLFRNNIPATKDNIDKQNEIDASTSRILDSELRRFVQRQVLTEQQGTYNCKVPLFRLWLESVGSRQILLTFTDMDRALQRRQREEEVQITSEEIIEVVKGWDLYQGKRITEDRVRAWLQQFDDYLSQRAMFRILQGLEFYSDDRIRTKMQDAHGIVMRDLSKRFKEGQRDLSRIDPSQRRRRNIIVTYLDSPGKSSGGKYAKLYKDENKIYHENVVERNSLCDILEDSSTDLQAIVIVDDMIGSGNTANSGLQSLFTELADTLIERAVAVYYVAITGFTEKQSMLQQIFDNYKVEGGVYIVDPLDDSARCFSEKSNIYKIERERLEALQIAQEWGAHLVRKNPLGYGNCQTTIVFSDTCPNNSLPILWAESEAPLWKPLFKRPLA